MAITLADIAAHLDTCQEPPSVAFSEKVPPSYESIAATFDFQHHAGTDPNLELKVLKNILKRESTIAKIKISITKLEEEEEMRNFMKAHSRDDTVEKHFEKVCNKDTLLKKFTCLFDYFSEIRELSAKVIETILVWREEAQEKNQMQFQNLCFYWHGENYLVKMLHDMDFLADVDALISSLNINKDFFIGNPLLLFTKDKNLDNDDNIVKNEDTDKKIGSRTKKMKAIISLPEVKGDEIEKMKNLAKILDMENTFVIQQEQLSSLKSMINNPLLNKDDLGTVPSNQQELSNFNKGVDPLLFQKKTDVLAWHTEAIRQKEWLEKSMQKGREAITLMDKAQKLYRMMEKNKFKDTKFPGGNKSMLMPVDDNPVLSLDEQNFRHPFEVELEEGGKVPAGMNFSTNQKLIMKSKKNRQLPHRSLLPPSLRNVKSKYLDPVKPRPRFVQDPDYEDRTAKNRSTVNDPLGASNTDGLLVGEEAPKIKIHVNNSKPENSKNTRSSMLRSKKKSSSRSPKNKNTSKVENMKDKTASSLVPEIEESKKIITNTTSSTSKRRRSSNKNKFLIGQLNAITHGITTKNLEKLLQIETPTHGLVVTAAALLILLAPKLEVPSNVTWAALMVKLSTEADREEFLKDLRLFNPSQVPTYKIRALSQHVSGTPDLLPHTVLESKSAPQTIAAELSAWMYLAMLMQDSFVENLGSQVISDIKASVQLVIDHLATMPNPQEMIPVIRTESEIPSFPEKPTNPSVESEDNEGVTQSNPPTEQQTIETTKDQNIKKDKVEVEEDNKQNDFANSLNKNVGKEDLGVEEKAPLVTTISKEESKQFEVEEDSKQNDFANPLNKNVGKEDLSVEEKAPLGTIISKEESKHQIQETDEYEEDYNQDTFDNTAGDTISKESPTGKPSNQIAASTVEGAGKIEETDDYEEDYNDDGFE